MSDPSTLRIEIRPSRELAALLAAAHILALVAAWIALGGWPRYLVEFGILLSAAGCLAEVFQRSDRSATSVELRGDGSASWRDRAGVWHEGRLGRDHYLSPVLVVVELRREDRGRKRIVLFVGSTPSEEMRRLRIWLRWHPVGSKDG